MQPTNKNVLKDREKYIGSSEISTIMGINHFKTRFTLLLEKAGLKEVENIDNEYVNFGSEIEKYIRDYINQGYQDDLFVEDTIIKEHDILNLRTNYDGLSSNTALEIKSTSIIHENVDDYKYYLVQLLYGMILANVDKGILAVYKRNENFELKFEPERLQMFYVNINDYKDLCVEIMEQVEQFCIDLKKLKENPFLTEQDLIKSNVVELANEVLKLEKELQGYKQLVERYENFKSELKNAMQENNIKKWETPTGTEFILVEDTQDKEVETKEFNIDKFKEENETMYEYYVENKKVLKKGRKGYVKIILGER